MGLRVTATAPINMTFMGVPVVGTLGRGVRTGDDTPIIGLMDWLDPTQFGSLIFYDFTPARAQRVMTRATNRGGLQLSPDDEGWISLVVKPADLQAALTTLGLLTP